MSGCVRAEKRGEQHGPIKHLPVEIPVTSPTMNGLEEDNEFRDTSMSIICIANICLKTGPLPGTLNYQEIQEWS